MKTEGVTKWNDKCDTTFRELATSSAFLSSKFYDQQGHIQSLENISGTLHESMKRFNRPATKYGSGNIIRFRCCTCATILFKEGAKGVNEMWDSMSKVTAADVAATKIDTLKGTTYITRFSVFYNEKTIGDALAPVVSVFVAGLQKLVDGFNALPGPVQKAIAITWWYCSCFNSCCCCNRCSFSGSWNGYVRDWSASKHH